MTTQPSETLWFEELGRGDVAPRRRQERLARRDGRRRSARKGVRVPPGFATTADAYWRYLEANGLRATIADALARPRRRTGDARRGRAGDPRGHPRAANGRPKPRRRSRAAYRELCRRVGQGRRRRRRALQRHRRGPAGRELRRPAGDLPQRPRRRRRCSTPAGAAIASLFTDRAISYRDAKGFDHIKVALSIGVQRMVRSDLGGSGVMFSIDTETGFDKVVLINAAWGLGENVVQGAVDPDEYRGVQAAARRPGARADRREEAAATKALKMIYAGGGERRDQERADLAAPSARPSCSSDDEILDARPLGGRHRGALRLPDGHGMGEGRRDRRAVHRPGAAGDGAVAARRRRVQDAIVITEQGRKLVTGPRRSATRSSPAGSA